MSPCSTYARFLHHEDWGISNLHLPSKTRRSSSVDEGALGVRPEWHSPGRCLLGSFDTFSGVHIDVEILLGTPSTLMAGVRYTLGSLRGPPSVPEKALLLHRYCLLLVAWNPKYMPWNRSCSKVSALTPLATGNQN